MHFRPRIVQTLVAASLVAAGPAQGALLLRDGDLVPARPVDFDVQAALQRLCAGPTPGERAAGLGTALPTGTRLLALRVGRDAATVVLDATFAQAIAAGRVEQALEQVGKTVLHTAPVHSVHVHVVLQDGREVDVAALLPGPATVAHPALLPPQIGTDDPPANGALVGRRIAVSPGHGYYWHSTLGWTTQRGVIDGLIEDIHTAEVCNHYLIPMLENLGAHVVLCREHGDVDVEALGDNDQGSPAYVETGAWSTSASAGWQGGTYRFAGTAPAVSATASWTVPVPRDGLYPVYAYFRAGSNRAPDARYTIVHAGGASVIHVDQTRDDRTFVWLGDFWFTQAAGARVVLDNESGVAARVVIADVVRVGSGRGSIARGGSTSGRPRWQECARYWAQFTGAPASVWDSIAGGEDSDDDVTCRPRLAEWRTADAYVSVHTNAGGGAGTSSYIHDTAPSAGSATLQQRIHAQLIADLRAEYAPSWTDRGQLSANFGEVRLLSTMPGVLLELAFHDTPGSLDHRAIHDPKWRYLAARAIARGVLRYFQPLAPFPPEPPPALRVVQDGARGLRVAWDAAAGATGYTVETSPDGKGFAPVAAVAGTSWSTGPLAPGTVRSFRVRATNASGQSVPTEVLTAGTDHLGAAQVLLVQGFDRFDRFVKFPDNTRDYLRLCGDAARREATFSCGFDAASNEAVQLGRVALAPYRAVVWSLGEESTADETFGALEQQLVQSYLAGGGRLLASGAEIAWDLDAQGGAGDRTFLRSVLGTAYVADDAGTYALQAGAPGGIFAGLPVSRFDDGTFGTYDVDWPDVLAPADAQSSVCLRYGNGQVAGIQRQTASSRVVVLGFPLETVTDASLRAALLRRALAFLLDPLPLSAPDRAPIGQRLPLQVTVPADAGSAYLLLASDATAPGIPLPGGGLLPLRPGFLVSASLDPGNPFFGNFLGTLDGSGRAAAWVDVPFLPELVGLQVFFSGLTMQPGPAVLERTVWNWTATTVAN